LRLVELQQQLDCQRLQQELKAKLSCHRQQQQQQQQQQQLALRSCRCQRCLSC
jgi:hypothetical protein